VSAARASARRGIKDFHHPVVGDITLTYNRVELSADPGLTVMTYVAEPGSKSAEALQLLGSWASTSALGRTKVTVI
jgi:hypothetical protein